MLQTSLFDPDAPKKSINLSIKSDVLRLARQLDLNLSQVFEQHLKELVREILAQEWLEENSEAIKNYNDRIEKSGVFSDGLRRF